ncbi:MAG TPA: hypothetical protein VJ508_10890, partial [Saprospiraceae bacterium]|nr:hypothetical protein [Saprospiraceae bacterium]
GRTPLLGEGNIRRSASPAEAGDINFWFSVGPYTMAPGDTIRLSYAFVCGYGIDRGVNSIKENALRAHILHARNFHFPVSPPSPKLALEEGFRRITLRWSGHLDDTNPLETWDDQNKYVETFPDTHWRRRNPPPGHWGGGRIFKGYRVYRSEDPAGHPSTFTLLRQYEVQDSSSELVTPLDSVFVDSNLVREKVYWYAVTSFGINDYAVIKYQDFDGTIRTDTHTVGFNESDLLENRVRVELPFTVSQKLGDVLVVPNPYRVDRDYTLEEGGWEGRSTHWTENQRLIRFIHLPHKCTIRIYSLAGDIISTLHHDDPVRGDEEWTLLSDSNRAIASGVYVFTVASDLGTQIGKFVVIR